MSVRYKRHEHKPCEPGYSPHRGPGAQHVHLAPAIAARSSHAKILAPFTPGRRSGVRHQGRREIPRIRAALAGAPYQAAATR